MKEMDRPRRGEGSNVSGDIRRPLVLYLPDRWAVAGPGCHAQYLSSRATNRVSPDGCTCTQSGRQQAGQGT
jgi:hypothetical protein